MDAKIFGLNLLHETAIGRKTLINLITEAGSLEQLLSNTIDNSPLEIHNKFFEKTKNAIKIDSKYSNILDKLDINYNFFFEDIYPEILKEIPDFPVILFSKGNIDLLSKDKIALVGTRNPSRYGEDQAKYFAKGLSEYGYVIISGMAMGIDKISHDETIRNNGYTIAVLAGAVHKSSPAINQSTYDSILKNNGLIISEYSPFVKIKPGMFASRNRIISGLSKGVLVIEAPKKSGSLITADLALDQGREVFAIPGNINSKNTEGTNNLIKESKAKLVQNVKDILDELQIGNTKSNLPVFSNLNQDETSFYNLICQGYSTIDELSIISKVDIGATINICTTLEIKNLIKKDFSGKYMLA